MCAKKYQTDFKAIRTTHMLTISCVDMKIRVNKMRSDDHIKTLKCGQRVDRVSVNLKQKKVTIAMV